jgi:hypothetical protein
MWLLVFTATAQAQQKRGVGFYNTTLVSFAAGSSQSNFLRMGGGISNISGYYLSPSMGIGLGVGFDDYAGSGETIFPVFGDVRCFFPLKNKKGNYYLSLAGGYGFAFERKIFNITDARGGYMLHPAVGYRALTAEGMDVVFDIGVKFQKARFTRTPSISYEEIQDVLYRRFVIRAGLSLSRKRGNW